ncbi:MAG: response regulator [Nitrospira sp.]
MVDLLGCTVTRADNGCEALDAASQTAFDLILMDCQMPEMDAFTAATAIRRQETDANDGRPVPIVALTANAMEGDRARCLAAGMDDYLAKPLRCPIEGRAHAVADVGADSRSRCGPDDRPPSRSCHFACERPGQARRGGRR